MNKLVSIIIPAYNVDPYIKECLISTLNQTYSNLEIIVINDGSTDNTGAICDELASTDSRINVIHKPNGGISEARNVGVENCTGDYIFFLDSDDYIHPNTIKLLVDAIESGDSVYDMAICREQAFYEGDTMVAESHDAPINLTTISRDDLIDMLCEPFSGIATWAWNKLYQRDFIIDQSFIVDKTMEDIFYSSDIIKSVNSCIMIDNRLYFYRQRKGSIMHVASPSTLVNHCESLIYQFEELKDLCNANQKSQFLSVSLSKINQVYKRARKAHYSEKSIIKKMQNSFYHDNKKYLKSTKDKVKMFFKIRLAL